VSENVSATGAVSNVASYGNVTGTGDYVGGIAGYGALLSVTDSNVYGSVEGIDHVGGIAGYANNITGSNAFGSVNSDVVNFASANGAAATMSNQTGAYTASDQVADAQTPGSSTGQAANPEDNIFFDSSNYSATVKTVVVDGVEYHVGDEPNDTEQKHKK
jgi:hypothetical protein